MRHILHLLTQPPDDVVRGVLEHQRARAAADGLQVQVIDLASPAVDFDAVLDAVFTADSISTW